jgi:GMP synthase (glutamine-hydrolysing)
MEYMKKLFIIKAGSTFASTLDRFGDFEEWIAAGLGRVEMPVHVVDVVKGEPLPSREECGGVVVTGSHAMVTDNREWSLGIERWIPGLLQAEVPYLGICYGHQLLGRAAGGEVGFHPLGREIGSVEVTLTAEARADALFTGLPPAFRSHVIHAQSVLHLPPGAVRLAWNEHEPNHAFRVGVCAWGVQFHPEFSDEVMSAYIESQRLGLEYAGRDVEAMLRGVCGTPEAGEVLVNFVRYLQGEP